MSWEADKLLLRGEAPGTFNLAVGEPRFLQAHFWDIYGEALRECCADTPSYTYPASVPTLVLRSKLEEVYPGKHVVVACGGKHALTAAASALRTLGLRRKAYYFHQAPYWPSHPTVALLAGAEELDPIRGEGNISVNTYPNNPDGRMAAADTHHDIWDAAYAHEVYGWNGREPLHETSCWSASKLLGLSGMRVGWVATTNADVARIAAAYIEQTTSGVPAICQDVVGRVLATARPWSSRYEAARADLEKNAASFRTLIAPHCTDIQGVPATGQGMFAWFRVKDHNRFDAALLASKVYVVQGWACGEPEPGWYRMSMGHLPAVTEEALTTLSKELQ